MNRQQVQTQEFARNLKPEVRIGCSKCRKEYPLDDALKERPMPPPNETVTQGYLHCPLCGDEKHVYYMTELLRFKQSELKKALEKWHETKKPSVWEEYARLQKKFQHLYDIAQKRYQEMFKKEEPGGPRK